jgi:hypothetical protein
VVEPGISVLGGSTTHAQGSDCGLGNDGADFTGCSRDTVGGRAVARWEALAGDDERRCIWSEVEELSEFSNVRK